MPGRFRVFGVFFEGSKVTGLLRKGLTPLFAAANSSSTPRLALEKVRPRLPSAGVISLQARRHKIRSEHRMPNEACWRDQDQELAA